MDELKKKVNIMSLVKKKNASELDSVLFNLKNMNDLCDELKEKCRLASNELNECNKSLSQSMQEQVNVEQVKLLNKYAQKLEVDLLEKKRHFNEAEEKRVELKIRLTKLISQGKVFDSALQKREKEFAEELIKLDDKGSEDSWLASRYSSEH